MLPFVILALGLFYAVIADTATDRLLTHWEDTQSAVRRAEVAQIARTVMDWHNATGSYPADLATLAAWRRDIAPITARGAVEYRLAPSLDDGVWRYDRSVVAAQPPSTWMPWDDFFAAGQNACGEAFATAADWCGRSDAHWWRSEGRDGITATFSAQRQRMRLTLNRVARHFNASQSLPAGLADGSTSTLASLAGYGGAATNCFGVRLWDAMPLGCEDLYSVWGTPVVAHRASGRLYLVARSTFTRSDGTSVPVSSHLDTEAP